MKRVTMIDAVAVPLDESDIDTDQLAPGRFLSKPVTSDVLLHDRRFDSRGDRRQEFVLNYPAYAGARVLVTRRNMGIGSSREAAANAVAMAGFDCVIAASFGDIFHGNCLQNGILPIVLEDSAIDDLIAFLQASPGRHLAIDLPAQTVAGEGLQTRHFTISPRRKRCLVEGLDDFALSAQFGDALATFEAGYYTTRPWLAQGHKI
jgi:3-isopropylmalate/(R)-2-methylmalate dehydratase small subunit